MLHELLRRRVPQALIAYFVAGWGLVQFLQFLEERYRISPSWVDAGGALVLLLAPAVFTFAWSQGAPGHDRWSRRQLAIICGNAVIALTVVAFFLPQRDVEATTTTVTVQTEDGDTIERRVPREELRRTVATFFPNVDSLEEEEGWWSYAMLMLLENSLYQDPFLDPRSAWMLQQSIQRAGIMDLRKVQRPLARELAAKQGADYFVRSQIVRLDDRFVLDVEVGDAVSGRAVGNSQFEFDASDVFETADRASQWIRGTLGVPQLDGEEFQVRPVRDVLTESTEALREVAIGAAAQMLENDSTGAIERYLRAAELDPTFCAAYLQLYTAYSALGQTDEAKGAIDEAMRHAYRLGERSQYIVRTAYYGARSDTDRAMAVLKMWAQVMPNDVAAHRLLAMNYEILGDRDLSLAEYERILELLPEDLTALSQIADLAVEDGDYERAEAAARQLVDLQPDSPQGLLELASVQRQNGRLEEARASLERAALLDPADVDLRMATADLDHRMGDSASAQRTYEEIRAEATAPRDRVRCTAELMEILNDRGRYQDCAAMIPEWETSAAEVYSFGELQVRTSRILPLLVQAGRGDEAHSRYETMHASLPDPIRGFLGLGLAVIGLEAGNPEEAREGIETSERAVRTVGVDALWPTLHALRARLALLEGNPELAIAHTDTAWGLDRSMSGLLITRARAQLAAGDPTAALDSIDRYLRTHPAYGEARLEKALVLEALDRSDDALAEATAAVEYWRDADPEHTDRASAQSLIDRLR